MPVSRAKLILDETFVHASNSHHSMEPRTAMAYWQNGKCFAHVLMPQSQSFIRRSPAVIGIPPTDLVLIAEYWAAASARRAAPIRSRRCPR